MNIRDAKAKATSGKISIGTIRKIIADARERGGMSTLNPAFSISQACNIYEAALLSRDDCEIPVGMRVDPYRPGRMTRTGDSLLIQNILRDCA